MHKAANLQELLAQGADDLITTTPLPYILRWLEQEIETTSNSFRTSDKPIPKAHYDGRLYSLLKVQAFITELNLNE